MRLLVAYDGSAAAEAAVEEVAARPWPAGSEVRLITVLEPECGPVPPGAAEACLLLECVHAVLRRRAYHRLLSVQRRLALRGDLRATCELRDGSAKEALLSAIRDWQPDLVVGGARGTGGFEEAGVGSVCEALLACAPCNVEIVRPAAAAR